MAISFKGDESNDNGPYESEHDDDDEDNASDKTLDPADLSSDDSVSSSQAMPTYFENSREEKLPARVSSLVIKAVFAKLPD